MTWSQCPQLRRSMCKKFNQDQNSLYVISFYAKDTACHFMAFQLLCWCPEARHISGNQGGSPATTGVPMLVWDPMFTLDLGVAWNIEAWHVVWYVWRHLPGECQKVQHTLGQGCTAHTLVCSTANMVGCGTAWVFTFAKDALLCRAAHGQIDSHQLPKVVMPSAVYVGVVHVKFACWLSYNCVLCPVGWERFLEQHHQKERCFLDLGRGPSVKKHQQHQKTVWERSRPAIEKFQNKLTQKRRSEIKERCIWNDWFLSTWKVHTLSKWFLQGLCMFGTSGLSKQEQDRDRETQSPQWESVCNWVVHGRPTIKFARFN